MWFRCTDRNVVTMMLRLLLEDNVKDRIPAPTATTIVPVLHHLLLLLVLRLLFRLLLPMVVGLLCCCSCSCCLLSFFFFFFFLFAAAAAGASARISFFVFVRLSGLDGCPCGLLVYDSSFLLFVVCCLLLTFAVAMLRQPPASSFLGVGVSVLTPVGTCWYHGKCNRASYGHSSGLLF